MEDKKCPLCNDNLIMMWGCGWDYDRLLCGNKDCDYEKELETTTYYEGYEEDKNNMFLSTKVTQ